MLTLRDKLANAITEHDRKESTRRSRYYNRNALGLMLAALNSAMADVDAGKDVRKALNEHFNDRLLTKLLGVACVPTAS